MLQYCEVYCVGGDDSFGVFDEVIEFVVFVFIEWGVQGDWFMVVFLYFDYFFWGYVEFMVEFFWSGFVIEVLQYLLLYVGEFVDDFDYVYWDVDCVGLVGYCVGDCLMDLLGGVG